MNKTKEKPCPLVLAAKIKEKSNIVRRAQLKVLEIEMFRHDQGCHNLINLFIISDLE